MRIDRPTILDFRNCQVANATGDGYLSSGDWSTFNAKQASGDYALAEGTGEFATTGWVDSNYYPMNSNPSGYLTLPLPYLELTGVIDDTCSGEGRMWFRSGLCELRAQICGVIYKLPMTPV